MSKPYCIALISPRSGLGLEAEPIPVHGGTTLPHVTAKDVPKMTNPLNLTQHSCELLKIEIVYI